MLNLCIVTPTRKRWQWLGLQAERLGQQMAEGDRWVVVVDADAPGEDFEQTLAAVGGKAIVVELTYPWTFPPIGNVNRARNAGAAMCPAHCQGIVEVDDHDLIEAGALDAAREALRRGADYVFGDHATCALCEITPGTQILETWPDVEHTYEPGSFTSGAIDGVGFRAISKSLWRRLGGWDADKFPGGDVDFACRAERAGARIVHLQQKLCTVTIDPVSIMASMRETAAKAKGG